MTGILEHVIAHGNKVSTAKLRAGTGRQGNNWVTCYDGFKFSVIAGPGTYCTPRPPLIPGLPYTGNADPEYPGPYTEVEVGFPTERPEPWDAWEPHCEDPDDPTQTVYGYVSVDLVRLLVAAHGGES